MIYISGAVNSPSPRSLCSRHRLRESAWNSNATSVGIISFEISPNVPIAYVYHELVLVSSSSLPTFFNSNLEKIATTFSMRRFCGFLFIVFCSITSAWPHPDEALEMFSDPGWSPDPESSFDLQSTYDISMLPPTTDLDAAQTEPAECPTDDNTVQPPDSNTVTGNPPSSLENLSLDTDLFNGLTAMTSYGDAPPCGPDGTHFRVCCGELWGAPSILSGCRSGTYI